MSTDRNPPRVLRPRRWLLALVIGVALLFIAGAVFTLWHSGWTLVSVTFVGMSMLACAGILEVGTSRIVLAEDSLEFGSLWSRRRYTATDIVSVTWEGGAGVFLKLGNGRWAKPPMLGYNSQSLTNSLRAWLKRSRPTE
jgi:hypothetical protein